MRAAERDRGNSRERENLLVRQVDEEEGVVIEARDRYHNNRYKAIVGIDKYISKLGKEL